MVASVLAVLIAAPAFSQFHQRHADAVSESSEVHPVPGGKRFSVPYSSDKAFAAIVKYLNSSDRYIVESANRDAGLIATGMEIKGKWRQTGTRVVITVVSDSTSSAIVRVAVTEQKRFKALQAEPWSDPKVDEKASAALAAEIEHALTGGTAG
jgi:hypothetical protein